MILLRSFLLVLFAAAGMFCRAAAQPHSPPPTPTADPSVAGSDGPHIFYQGNKILMKSVVMADSVATLHKQVARFKWELHPTCIVAETRDTFSFKLHDSLETPPSVYPLPERMLVLSDIEGDFKALKMMLLGAGVMDRNFNWTFGQGHLVLLGDYFDRGLSVTECLWLCYKLEGEAAAAGGRVHFILGNHEVMNLSGDQRYVRNKYFENADLIGEPYNTWYSADTELGRWLRSKNAIEQIGDYGFCHAGLSSNLASTRMNLSDINRIARRYYGVPEPKISNPDAAAIFSSLTGVFWYREMAKNKLSTSEVNDILNRYGLKRLVVGHTLQSDVNTLYHGKLICVDLYHEENVREGFVKTLLVENGIPYSLDSRGEQMSVIVVPTLARDGNE